jgi:hypothetical protein
MSKIDFESYFQAFYSWQSSWKILVTELSGFGPLNGVNY